ncbi:hypothetical protein [Microseira wollei]|uniref:Transposase n=1 Tax=Microseira wollei NIES-4236 TaxID=2530354 RepID=A0AAV3XR09_9CYAN|nr:hypothetical protein [Microseira wollei]GET43012.1 hypothetical protein MiSe_78320 [Microseira wollei NIES-4236]
MILVDTAGSVEFLHGVRRLKFHVIARVSCDRQLVDARRLRQLCKRGQPVRLIGLKFPVSVSWYYLKRDNGQLEKRFILSTKQLKASRITWWGRRRWLKTAKHRFGLHRFGQGTLLGVYRWLVLSLLAYLLAHWAYLSTNSTDLPDGGQAALTALEFVWPQIVVCLFLLNLERMIALARSYGFDIHFSWCKM